MDNATYTRQGAADFLLCSTKTIDRLIKVGLLIPIYLGRGPKARVRITKASLFALAGLESRMHQRRQAAQAEREWHAACAATGATG